MYFSRRYLKRFKKLKDANEFLSYSSTAIISALFITSFVSFPVNWEDLGIDIVALVFVFASYKMWKNLGISAIVGVTAHILLFWLF